MFLVFFLEGTIRENLPIVETLYSVVWCHYRRGNTESQSALSNIFMCDVGHLQVRCRLSSNTCLRAASYPTIFIGGLVTSQGSLLSRGSPLVASLAIHPLSGTIIR
jgi:hypothetical protein